MHERVEIYGERLRHKLAIDKIQRNNVLLNADGLIITRTQ